LDVRRSPFFLYPELPRFNNSEASTIEKQWSGPWPLKWGDRLDVLYSPSARRQIADLGKSVGYNFNFDAISSNTFDSHRALLWAEEKGLGVEYGKILARKYFEEGQALSDHTVLSSAAGEVGLSENEALAFLATAGKAEEVKRRYEAIRKQGITSIPVFMLEADGETTVVHGSASQVQFQNALRKFVA
jgi:predicted DsbA family dithiol-disulfide isomerase